MEFSGWVFLLASCLSVIALTGWCFFRVLTLPSSEDVQEEFHAPLEIETHEQE